MTNIRLISEDYLKNNSTIIQNVEMKYINSTIDNCQRIQIQQLLGTNLYDKIISLVSGGTISSVGNENYKNLLDNYIVPALAQYIFADALPFIHYKVMNKGVTNQSSDNSISVGLEEIKYLTDKATNTAEFLGKRCQEYIKANQSYYPEYYTTNTCDQMSPASTPYFSGIQLSEGRCSGELTYITKDLI
jgi:hypothetical protein